jgi:hypothetical protein
VAGLVSWIGAGGPGLCAVLHAAGVLDDGVLDGLEVSRLAGVWVAKAAGAAWLDELTAELDLERFVLFSSAAGTLGSAGQGNYAAANAFLDALAEQRAARGLAATSVAWGPWAGGMARGSDAVRQRLRRGALPEMDPGRAIEALGQAVAAGETVLTVMDADWARWPGAGGLPLLRDLPEARPATGGTGAGAGRDEGLAGRLAGLGEAEQLRMLAALVRAEAAAHGGVRLSQRDGAGRVLADRTGRDRDRRRADGG